MDEHFFIYNEKYFPLDTPIISTASRALRYGDGLFETMRMYQGKILNESYHFERLFNGMKLLQFKIPKIFSKELLIQKINALLKKNEHSKNARIRLMVFRGKEELFSWGESNPEYIIESWALPGKIELNENGLTINVFPDAKKSNDAFSNLKCNNYLPSAMAAIYAKKHQWNDAIILNTSNRVCETAIANIFIIKDHQILTPPLSEGCVAGTVRRFILENTWQVYKIEEKPLTVDDVLSANEVFLTNAIHPIRWVKNFGDRNYDNKKVLQIFNELQARF
jgi:branched-chain amino acid aminotransferase